MGGLSLWHWLIVVIVIMLFFGRGKMSDLMGDFAKGIKSFKQGLADDETPAATPVPPSQIAAQQPVPPVHSVPTDAPRV